MWGWNHLGLEPCGAREVWSWGLCGAGAVWGWGSVRLRDCEAKSMWG